MSELNKLAGRFIYKGCWGKTNVVIKVFKKVKQKKQTKNTETNFGLVWFS